MQKNSMLKEQVKGILLDEARNLKPGKTSTIDFRKHVKIDSGESIIGYQYLHGTESTVGGFHIDGTITKNSKGEVTFDLHYQWNDIMDPNYGYDSDTWKSMLCKLAVSMLRYPNGCKPYTMRIGWGSKSIYRPGGKSSGWPFS